MGVGNVVVELALVVEPHALLLVGEGDLDAELAPPHLLDGLEQPLVELQRGELDLHLREAAAAGITGLRQQPAGPCKIVGDGGAGGVAGGAGRRQAVRRLLAAERRLTADAPVSNIRRMTTAVRIKAYPTPARAAD